MDYIELDIEDTFIDIFYRAFDCAFNAGDSVWPSASCENALLALEAAHIGVPVEDFTAEYREFLKTFVPF